MLFSAALYIACSELYALSVSSIWSKRLLKRGTAKESVGYVEPDMRVVISLKGFKNFWINIRSSYSLSSSTRCLIWESAHAILTSALNK